MTIGPTQGPGGFNPINPHFGQTPKSASSQLINELQNLVQPFSSDLGDGNTPGSFAYLVDIKNPTAQQKQEITEKYQDLKQDLAKIHQFLNKNEKALQKLGLEHHWNGQGGGMTAKTVDDVIQSFNGLYQMFNAGDSDPGETCGHADMIASDLTYIYQMISSDRPQ